MRIYVELEQQCIMKETARVIIMAVYFFERTLMLIKIPNECK